MTPDGNLNLQEQRVPEMKNKKTEINKSLDTYFLSLLISASLNDIKLPKVVTKAMYCWVYYIRICIFVYIYRQMYVHIYIYTHIYMRERACIPIIPQNREEDCIDLCKSKVSISHWLVLI